MKYAYSLIPGLLLLIYSTSVAQNLVINEFQARNAFTLQDDYQEYDDWIEIANFSGVAVNLNGYFITDDMNMKSKSCLSSTGNDFLIPSGGHLLLWADDDEDQGNHHLSFNISAGSGLLALFSPDLQLVDSVNYSQQYMDVSMGRLPVVPHGWRYYQEPTPGAGNTSQPFMGVTGSPVMNKSSGIYNAPVTVTISPSQTADSIYYTLNNTLPEATSLLYKNALAIGSTKVINAIGAKSGYINSSEVSCLYITRPAFTLPVMAVLTDTSNLFGPQGIYTNYNLPWERFCKIHYLSNGTLTAESNAGIRLQGASSLYMPKKGFRLFFRGSYGNKKFEYPVFGENQIESFDKLVLKPGYDDDLTQDGGTLLRDALALELWKKTGGLEQSSSWVILYLNNRYWGIYNLRESIDENFIRDHTGFTDFDLIRFRNEGPDCVYGTTTSWNEMYNLAVNSDLLDEGNYDDLLKILDIDDFINLMAFVQFTNYYSWSWGASMFREVNPEARWRSSIWDADRAFSEKEWNGFQEALEKTDGLYWANRIPKNLMNNQEFRQQYANRLYYLEQTVFSPENAVAVLDSLYDIIAPEINDEQNRWVPGLEEWEVNVEAVRQFLLMRPAIVSAQRQNYLPEPIETGQFPMPERQPVVYPNPFRDRVAISILTRENEKIDISIYGPEGRMVKNLFSGCQPGVHEPVYWDGTAQNGLRVAPGMYIICLKTTEKIYHTKIILE